MKNKRRTIGYKFNNKTEALLEELKIKSGLNAKVDVIRRALTLFKLAVDARAAGKTIVIRSDNGDVEIEL